jgi:hypothetical protein
LLSRTPKLSSDLEVERPGLGHEIRVHRRADHVGVGAAVAWHLGVLLVEHKEQVSGDQGQQQTRDQQRVRDVEPGNEQMPGELAAEDEERHIGAHDRDRQQHALEDPHPGTGQQVIGQRVPGVALDDGQGEQGDADQPVHLPRLAERAGDEDPQHVHRDRGDEQVGGPVADLAHQQAAADVEADLQRRGVSLGHPDAIELHVRAVVHDLGHAWLEEQRQERPGQQQDDERIQGYLADQERPVIGEDLPEDAAQRRRAAQPVVSRLPRTGQCRTCLNHR